MKLAQLQVYLRQQKLPYAALFNFDEPSPNFKYLGQYDGYGCLIIPQRGKPTIIAPDMEAERARLSPSKVVAVKQGMKDKLKQYLKGKRIGIDGSGLSLQGYRALKKTLRGKKLIDVSPAVEHLRMTKTSEEIKHIAAGCAISDTIYKETFKHFQDFETEQDIATFMEMEAVKRGCKISFETIVASGKNASMPHHRPTDKKLQKGFCVIDFGVKYKGYCTDTTRTIFIGKPTKQHIQLYNLVLAAQTNTIAMVKPGIRCKAIHEHCAKALGMYGKYFIHGLGHGVGLQIHEAPSLGPTSKEKMQTGMAFTIEPGVYLPKKLGIRIEDTLLLRDNARVLTNITKKLLVF